MLFGAARLALANDRGYIRLMMPRSITLAAIGCGLLGGAPLLAQTAADPVPHVSTADELLRQQRATFREIFPDVERGDWTRAAENEALLQSYVLWPDLRATYLRARLRDIDEAEITAFLDEYGTLKPARELRYRYALMLAEQGRLADYHVIYRQYYQGLELPRLDCLALQAELGDGRQDRIVDRAHELWLVGKSQDDACEPVFDNLRQRSLLTETHYTERFKLAIDARRFSLARYLARSLDSAHLDEANRWLKAQNEPKEFLDAAQHLQDDELALDQLTYAISRVALYEPLLAQQYWETLSGRFSFGTQEGYEVQRHIALWAAREHLPEARDMLEALPAGAVDTETGRWRVRTSLLQDDWHAATDNIDALPGDEHQKPEWQFWKSVAQRETGQPDVADIELRRLAQDRSYYGFLAADAVNEPYAFEHNAATSDEALAAMLASEPALVRARELFLVGLDGRGRSEWDAAVRSMDRERKLQAALLAHHWGWHSRAIATIATAGNYDDLDVRYPLPWRDAFEAHAGSAAIPHSWAYGIARSESLFMRDVRSSAGAIGVMQLMPATGRETAREINLRYSGRNTLTDSESNIRLGTAYLGKMYKRFAENRVLATAAYNAGPHRVEKWTRDKDGVDARVWIENIPYRETRNYVRRVLTDEAIFHWRLTGEHKRISSELPTIDEASDTERLASAN